MKAKELLFWIWLAEGLGAASKDFKRLYSLNDSPYEYFRMEEAEIEPLDGISPKTKLALAKKDLRRATEILERCERDGYGILTYGDEGYPSLLREIDRPPVLLYYAGRLPSFSSSLAIGMVGTRRMSAYGLKTAYKISYELSAVGALVVSGMAAGIDGVAATAALEAGGSTVAVLGCGLDQVYPRHHGPLMQRIREKGLLLSEYAPGTKPNFYHFPIRNRIISGLCHGTLVVEAGNGSGSLITAGEAVRQGRDVFALPANVGAIGAEGTNGLLRDGARMVIETKDILDYYQLLFAETLHPERLANAETRSAADLLRLQALGVIDLGEKQPASTTASGALRASAPPEGQPSQRTTKRSGKAASKKSADTSASTSEKPSAANGLEQTGSAATESSVTSAPRQTPDAVLQSLSAVQRAVFEAIPDEGTVTADALCQLGHPYGECIAALTMLEIMGLVVKLPGSLYKKA